jgi:hypothetical protein
LRQTNPVTFPHAAWPEAFSAIRTVSLRDLYLLPPGGAGSISPVGVYDLFAQVLEAGDWRWSSFRHYALREKGVVEIESEWTAWDRERQAQGGAERIFLIPG